MGDRGGSSLRSSAAQSNPNGVWETVSSSAIIVIQFSGADITGKVSKTIFLETWNLHKLTLIGEN